MQHKHLLVLILIISGLAGCQNETASDSDQLEPEEIAELRDSLRETPRFHLKRERFTAFEPRMGDLDSLIRSREIRALVPYNHTDYFIDGTQRHGLAYESLFFFEMELNKQLPRGVPKVVVVYLPVTREEIFPLLKSGYGDLALGSLTITPEREKVVDFSMPIRENVAEVVVTGPAAPRIDTLTDLSGKVVWVRRSSSYFLHLQEVNEHFEKLGMPPVHIYPAPENLETEELLQMVNAGSIPMTIADEHLASLWEGVLDSIEIRHDLPVKENLSYGWAFRQNSPELAKVVNSFIRTHRKGTLFGNVMDKRYLKSRKYIKGHHSKAELEKFRETRDYFVQAGREFNLDWLMLTAQGYQESGLNQNIRSHAGAVGIMQVKPSTAADPIIGIKNVYTPKNNIRAGAKYMRYILDHHLDSLKGDELNHLLLALASYNAGPARIRRLRKMAKDQGLDPDQWFNHVELMAAKDIGRETVDYVDNIYKYYLSFKALEEYGPMKDASVINTQM